MEPLQGNDLRNMWQECEPAIGRKIAASYDISANDIRRCVAFITTLPPPSAPESPFFLTLGTPAQQQCPPLNSTLAQRTKEEWARTLYENKAVAIIQRMQKGKPALIPKECEEILPRRYPDWSPEMSGFLGAKIRPRLNTPFCVYCAIGL